MPFRSIAVAALQSAGLTIAGFVVPLLGQIAVLFAPVPLVVVAVREGRKAGFAALGIAGAIVAVVVSGKMVFVFFFLSFGLMAAGLSEGLRQRLKPEQAVFLGGLLPLAALLAILVPVLIKAGKNPVVLADEYFRTSIIEAQQLYTQLGLTEVAQMLSSVSDRVMHYLVRLSPGIIVTTSLLQAAFCYGVARTILLRKDPSLPISSQPTLATWHAPDSWVWGLIVTLGLIALTKGAPYFLGLNLALLYIVAYLAQGLCLLESWLRRAKIAVLWRSFIHTIVMTLPPFMAVIIALGVVDIWADFRKVRQPAQAP
jgi:uncharacterized protein YybS (DUF2232 family)